MAFVGVPSGYAAGQCNIGGAEVARRRLVGWLGVVATAVLAAVLWGLGAPVICRLALFLPAAVAASGFVQARASFCLGYGLRGGFNFGDRVGAFHEVASAADKAADRSRSLRMLATVVGVGAAVAAIALVLP